MRFSFVSALVVALAADATVASTWFGKTAYNKWHETELERWLSDNNVPYPTPADRKDLENLVKENWNDKVVTPYNSWDTNQLSNYLTLKGKQATKGTEKNKNKLVEQVKASWFETESQAESAYGNVRDWILDSWTESQLKAFLDKHGVPNPQPRTRDTLLSTARENYNSIAQKLGETAAYPGDWLYSSWSESDLKAWCDERAIPVPQPYSRDKVIAAIRRNSRVASNNFAHYSSVAAASAASATDAAAASASSATNYLSDALLASWSDSQIKEWADKNGIKVPQGSKRNELLALARKHRAQLTGDNVSASAASAYGAATSSAGNGFGYATSVAWDYINWIQAQAGLGASSLSKSATSATSVAGKSGSSAASVASKSALSASSLASKSALSASSVASKSAESVLSSISSAASSASSSASKAASTKGSKQAQQAGDAAAESVSKAKHRVQEAAQRATNYAKEEL